jgi:hypothetical protein
VPENLKIPGIPLTNIVGPRQQHLQYVYKLFFYEKSAPLVLIIVILAPNSFLAKMPKTVSNRIQKNTIRFVIQFTIQLYPFPCYTKTCMLVNNAIQFVIQFVIQFKLFRSPSTLMDIIQ